MSGVQVSISLTRKEQGALYMKSLRQADEIKRLKGIVAEVHAWVVCAPIATPEDMAQNLPRIAEITSPEFEGEGVTG